MGLKVELEEEAKKRAASCRGSHWPCLAIRRVHTVGLAHFCHTDAYCRKMGFYMMQYVVQFMLGTDDGN
jgi:hypothetical protein